MTPYNVAAAATAWRAAGCTIIPIRPDRSKAPAADQWRALHTSTTVVDTSSVFDTAVRAHGPDVGVAVLTGSSSGMLEMLEIEGPATQTAAIARQLDDLAARAGIGPLWQRLKAGYVEASPKGGVHFLYRLADAPVAGNTKLARRPARDDELHDAERRHLENKPGHVFPRTVIETRGQGGYVIVAPTPAACSGHDGPLQPWQHLTGRPDTIPTITAAERDEIHNLCRAVDTMPAREQPAAPQPRLPFPAGGDSDRPGDRYAREHTWSDILEPHGWRRLYEHGGKTYWCRPGKTNGVSATTTDEQGDDPGGLWVFSSSTVFAQETLYTKFGAYAHLEHHGDHSAAAAAIGGTSSALDQAIVLRPFAGPDMGKPGSAGAEAAAAGPTGAGTAASGGHAPGDPGTATIPRPPSWRPVDPTAFLAGTYTPPAGELLPRTDGISLLYRGKTHAFIGESESGKSLVVQAECARILKDDPAALVLYIDYEDTPDAVFGRMLLFGVDPEALRYRFHYVNPETNPYTALEADSFRQLLSTRYAIAVLDGVTDALLQEPGSQGNGDPNRVATAWARRVLDPLAEWTGAAVVMIDHQPKNAESRGRFAIGAQAKMSVITGAAYIVEPTGRLPIGRGLAGELSVRIAKDRPGGVRPHCGPRRAGDRTQEAARVVVDSTSPTGRIIVSINKQETGDVHAAGAQHDARAERTSELMDSISRYVSMVGAASGAQIRREIRGRTENVIDGVRSLVGGGYLDEQPNKGRGGGHRYTVIRPYVHTPAPTVDEPTVDEPVEATTAPMSFPVPEPVPTVSREQVPTVSEPVPVTVSPSPLRGTGTGTGTETGTEGKNNSDNAAAEPMATSAAPAVAFRAPVAPPSGWLATTAAPRRRLRPGEAPCEICGGPVDPQLVVDGVGRHLGC